MRTIKHIMMVMMAMTLASSYGSVTTNKLMNLNANSYVVTGVDIPVISATDPTFSNAVLSVGLNIDTNSVAVLNEIAATFGGFPIAGTATTIGGLLAALAAAVAWLKQKTASIESTVGTANTNLENALGGNS